MCHKVEDGVTGLGPGACYFVMKCEIQAPTMPQVSMAAFNPHTGYNLRVLQTLSVVNPNRNGRVAVGQRYLI